MITVDILSLHPIPPTWAGGSGSGTTGSGGAGASGASGASLAPPGNALAKLGWRAKNIQNMGWLGGGKGLISDVSNFFRILKFWAVLKYLGLRTTESRMGCWSYVVTRVALWQINV